jgi:integrase/recombinase XerD
MKRFGRPMLGFLSGQEMQAILHVSDSTTWVGQRDGALFTMLYNTGARASEIIGLRIKDVVLDTSPSAHIMGKGRKQRSVPLWQLTVRMMRTWKRRIGDVTDEAHMFPGRNGAAMTRSNVSQRLELAVKGAAERLPALRDRSISPHKALDNRLQSICCSPVSI